MLATSKQKKRRQLIWTIVTLVAVLAMVAFTLIPLFRF